MKTQDQRKARYTATTRATVKTRKANMRDTTPTDMSYLDQCVKNAMTQVQPIHTPGRAQKLYFERYPLTDCRPRVKILTCGACGGYLGAVELDDMDNYPCDYCGENQNESSIEIKI